MSNKKRYPCRGTLPSNAIGQENGDTLQLANQWARVTIARDVCEQGEVFICTGDLADHRAPQMAFPRMHLAVNYALRSLALFQKGRCS